jgi:small-conductance mechanosensitive channel
VSAHRSPASPLAALLLALALFTTGLSGTATAQEKPSADGELSAAPQSVAVAPVARDDQIAARIGNIVDATGWYRGSGISASDGVVFLDGDTNTDERRAWARELASKTEDVVAVVNRITVTPDVDWSFRPALREIESLLRKGFASLPLFALAIVILPLAFYAAKLVATLVERMLGRQVESPFLRGVIARVAAIPVFLIGLYLVLQVAGLTQLALSILGGAGVAGIIIGFAFRDIAENFLASLLLSIRQPFRRGDYISVGDQQGTVQSMNTRSTLLLSMEGNHIQIPNAVIFKSTIVNYSAAPARQEFLQIGIGYDVSVAHAQEIIRKVLAEHEAVLSDPEEPLVLVDSLGAATVNLRAYFWFDGHTYSVFKVRSALLRLVKKALMEANISMPDEAREVVFPQGVPVIGMGSAAGIAETPAPVQETAAEESGAAATASEGGLENETETLERHAATADIPEAGEDLLPEEKRTP